MYRVIIASDDNSFPKELKISIKEGAKGVYFYTIKDVDTALKVLRRYGWKECSTKRYDGSTAYVEKDDMLLRVNTNLVGSGYRGTNLFPESYFSKYDYAQLKSD